MTNWKAKDDLEKGKMLKMPKKSPSPKPPAKKLDEKTRKEIIAIIKDFPSPVKLWKE
jgi:hypothetical protein